MPPSVIASSVAEFDARFAAAMAILRLDSCESYLTALSGGADSTGLALLTQRYADAKRKAHKAVIVDHGLRDSSNAEARRVQNRLKEHGVVSEIISIPKPQPKSAVQEWARLNRYNILISAARQRNAALLFAHHAGDQAETVAMRLLRGSGPSGLAGIPALRSQYGVTIARPVLNWPSDQLPFFCSLRNCSYESDLSNKDRQFERVRIRQLLITLSQQADGPSSRQIQRLSKLAAKLTTAADEANFNHLSGAVKWNHAGYVKIMMGDLVCLPNFRWRLAIRRIVMAVSGGTYAPSAAALDRVRSRICAGQAATVGGCHFTPVQTSVETDGKSKEYRLFREIGRHFNVTQICGGDEVVFAGCWLVKSKQEGVLHALGDLERVTDEKRLGCLAKNLPDSWLSIPHRARQAIPVLTTLDGRLIYPQLRGVESRGSIMTLEAQFFGIAKNSAFLADKLIGKIS